MLVVFFQHCFVDRKWKIVGKNCKNLTIVQLQLSTQQKCPKIERMPKALTGRLQACSPYFPLEFIAPQKKRSHVEPGVPAFAMSFRGSTNSTCSRGKIGTASSRLIGIYTVI